MNKLFKILKSDEEYKKALTRTIEIFHADEGTPESDELDVLLLSVKNYEDKHFNLPAPDLSAY